METVTETGRLVKGRGRPGGEGPGWALETEDFKYIEVDLQRFRDEAFKFKGRFVTITGYYITQTFLESKPAEVLIAEQISLAAELERRALGLLWLEEAHFSL